MSVTCRDDGETAVVSSTGGNLSRDPCHIRRRMLDANRTSRDEWVSGYETQLGYTLKTYRSDEDDGEWLRMKNAIDVEEWI